MVKTVMITWASSALKSEIMEITACLSRSACLAICQHQYHTALAFAVCQVKHFLPKRCGRKFTRTFTERLHSTYTVGESSPMTLTQ